MQILNLSATPNVPKVRIDWSLERRGGFEIEPLRDGVDVSGLREGNSLRNPVAFDLDSEDPCKFAKI